MDIVLVAGLWLDASVWDSVASRLRQLGHHAVPVLLPGQGLAPADASLQAQHAAVLAALDASDGPALLVGHSAACTLVWMAADARPEKVSGVVMIGGFPVARGAYADTFPQQDGVMPFPGWEVFEGADSADLSDEQKESLAARAIPVPVAVAEGQVTLTDPRRFAIPVTLICPEFSAADARQWIEGGEVEELRRAESVDYLDIDSGHWPMLTCPDALAELLAGVADRG